MAKKIKKTIPFILAIALFACIFSGCGVEGGEDEEPIPEISEEGDTQTDYYKADNVFSLNCNKESSFNPFTTTNSSNILCTQLMYDTVFDVDENFMPESKLLESYKSDDGKCWYFYVDKTVKFWDGSTLTAQDVEYSIQRAMRSSQFSERLKPMIGVKAMDEELFIINLYNADMNFPVLLNIPVIKYGTVEDYAPMGTGMYMPDEAYTKLTAFTGHKNAASLPLDTIYLKEYTEIEDIITAFENSEIDLVTNNPTGFSNIGYGSVNEVRRYPTTNMIYIGFNSNSRFFSNPQFRKAITYVVDRERIVKDYMGGAATPAALPMNPACANYNDAYSEIISYSVKKGEMAFDEAQVQDYDDNGRREMMITGIPCDINIDFIVCSDSPIKVKSARCIVENLEDMGITVTLRELPWDDYISALNKGNFDMYYAETKLGANFSLRNLLFSGGSLNYGKFSDPLLEQYINEYMLCGEEERQKSADLMFKYITDTAPIVTVCFEKQEVITHRGVVSGMKPTMYNIFRGIENWKINLD